MKNEIIIGDCADVLKSVPSDSIDCIVTDPPYGYSFMGLEWDKALPSLEALKECNRVLKAGAFGFFMCAPRQDVLSRMIIRLEDAGFNTNFSSIFWSYASGFPKSAAMDKLIDKRGKENEKYSELSKELCNYLRESREALVLSQKDIAQYFPSRTGGLTGCVWNWENGANIPTMEQWVILKSVLKLDNDTVIQLIERAVLKREEAEREVISKHPNPAGTKGNTFPLGQECFITAPSTDKAKEFSGSFAGCNLKPALEVIITVMKPLDKSCKSYVDQALKNGHGVTWLDSVKIPYSPSTSQLSSSPSTSFDTRDCILDEAVHNVSSLHSPSQGVFDDTALKQLYESLLLFRDSVSPTTLYNKNCTNHDHREGDNGYSLDKELLRWVEETGVYLQQNNDHTRDQPLLSVLDSQSCCPVCLRLYDELLHLSQAFDQDVPPSQADVLGYIFEFLASHKHTHKNQYNAHLSNVGDLLHKLLGTALGDYLAYNNNTRHPLYNFSFDKPVSDGRFPANLLVSDNVLDRGIITKSAKLSGGEDRFIDWKETDGCKRTVLNSGKERGYNDSGDFSRYFSLDAWFDKKISELPTEQQKTFPFLITPKPSKSEKNRYIENKHPTVKPLKLMSYLITMGSREGDVILDPYAGSGTTLEACKLLNRVFIGIDKDPANEPLMRARGQLDSVTLETFQEVKA